MMAGLQESIIWLFGEKAIPSLHETMQTSLRAVVIFAVALLVVQLAHRRFFAKLAPLDILLTFTLGSTFSRAINGSAKLFESIMAAIVLVVLHNIFTYLTWRSHGLGTVLKGEPEKLVDSGRILEETPRAASPVLI